MNYFYINYKGNINIASIWVSGGSDKDSSNKKGINQVLSSLLLRGCKDFNNFSLSDYIDSYGAELNCETFEDGILINIKSIKLFFKEVYPILKLITEEPNLSKDQFEISKQNIINHIKKSKENPFNIAFENWRKLVYKNHSYAYDTNGYIKDINYINYNDILEEYSNFKKREKVLLSNHYYKNMNNIDSFSSHKSFDNKSTYKEEIITQFDNKFKMHYQNTNQLIILIGNKTCSYGHNDFINLKILESHLAFGMSSKLFRIFRERNGLTYDAGIFCPLRKSSAPFVIYLSSSLNNCLDTFKQLIKLWDQITAEKLSQKELDLAKVKLNTANLLTSQTAEEVINKKVQLLGFHMDPKHDEKLVEKISEITAKQVLDTAKKYLTNPSLSISGKYEYCNQIKKIWDNKY